MAESELDELNKKFLDLSVNNQTYEKRIKEVLKFISDLKRQHVNQENLLKANQTKLEEKKKAGEIELKKAEEEIPKSIELREQLLKKEATIQKWEFQLLNKIRKLKDESVEIDREMEKERENRSVVEKRKRQVFGSKKALFELMIDVTQLYFDPAHPPTPHIETGFILKIDPVTGITQKSGFQIDTTGKTQFELCQLRWQYASQTLKSK